MVASVTQVINWFLPKNQAKTTETEGSFPDPQGTVVPRSSFSPPVPKAKTESDKFLLRTHSKDIHRNSPIPRTSTPIVYPSPKPTLSLSQTQSAEKQEGDQFVKSDPPTIGATVVRQTEKLEQPAVKAADPPIHLPTLQNKLWDDYLTGKQKWDDMMNEARRLESEGRVQIFKEWNIQPRPKGQTYDSSGSENIIYRDGSDPSIFPGRGIFSDEDITANNRHIWNAMRKTVKDKGFEPEEDEGFEDSYIFRVPALNAVIWRPRPGGDSVLTGDEEFVKYVRFSATNVDAVDPSSNTPTFPMEKVIAMANKGQVGFAKPVEEWGEGYARYDALIQMAKATELAMKKTGLNELYRDEYKRLEALRRMQKSPEDLGIFKPGASEDEIKAGLRNEQTHIKDLFAKSFRLSQQQLTEKVQALNERIDAHEKLHKTHEWNNNKEAKRKEFEALVKDVLDAHNRLAKMEVQLQAQSLSSDHRKILEFLLLPKDLPVETSAKKKEQLFQTAYLKLESYIDAEKRKFGMFYLKEKYAHSPKAQLPDHTDGREEFLEAPEVVPTPPPDENLNEIQSDVEQPEGVRMRRRSSQMTLTPNVDQLLSERISL